MDPNRNGHVPGGYRPLRRPNGDLRRLVSLAFVVLWLWAACVVLAVFGLGGLCLWLWLGR